MAIDGEINVKGFSMPDLSLILELIGILGAVLTALFTGLYWRLVKKRGEAVLTLQITRVRGNRADGYLIIDNPGPGSMHFVGLKAHKPKGLRIALYESGYARNGMGGWSDNPIPIESEGIDYSFSIPPRESKEIRLAMDLPSNTRRASLVSVFVLSMALNRFFPARQPKKAAKARLKEPISKSIV